MTRHNFTVAQQRQMADRSGGKCEAGNGEYGAFYGLAEGVKCNNPAVDFDHITPDALKRTRIKSIDEGLHVCAACHAWKTANRDMPMIVKARHVADKQRGIRPAFRPMPGSKASGWKRCMNGEVVRR